MPKGISAFMVESSYKGYKVGSIFEKIGIHASLTLRAHLRGYARPQGEPPRQGGGRFQDSDGNP
ncbi:MAG: hypothetical protein MZU91_13165 [Desulfosudis oleivorans]|nr:hypothetical protein [Desulfosudis oleivorans]